MNTYARSQLKNLEIIVPHIKRSIFIFIYLFCGLFNDALATLEWMDDRWMIIWKETTLA
jgi:hypothetical protein